MTETQTQHMVGIIGGSGIYDISGIENVKEVTVSTPFGDPSDTIVTGELDGVRCAFLPRHGRGHRILPTEVNNRANIYALKSLGVTQVISLSACGSLREDIKPRDFVLPDQLVDGTKGRPATFFGGGFVAHIGFAEPFCRSLREIIHKQVAALGIPHHFGGVYACMEGPAFSTRAESEFNRRQGYSVIGMTAAPEAKLAREAELCYATVAMVTDYDVWKEGDEVTLELVMANMDANVTSAKRLIKQILPALAQRHCNQGCEHWLADAMVTDPEKTPPETLARLGLLIDKYFK